MAKDLNRMDFIRQRHYPLSQPKEGGSGSQISRKLDAVTVSSSESSAASKGKQVSGRMAKLGGAMSEIAQETKQAWEQCVERLRKLDYRATLTAVLEDGPQEGIDYEALGNGEPVASPQATRPLPHHKYKTIRHKSEADAILAERAAQPVAGTTPNDWNRIDATTGIPKPSEGTTPQAERPAQIAIHIFQQDWMPGFAAFHDDGCISETAKAHVVLNLGSFMSAIQQKALDPKDLPYFVAESLMHEVIHVLEAWANVEFSEDRVEALLTKYREKYERATIWEYTGGEPHE